MIRLRSSIKNRSFQASLSGHPPRRHSISPAVDCFAGFPIAPTKKSSRTAYVTLNATLLRTHLLRRMIQDLISISKSIHTFHMVLAFLLYICVIPHPSVSSQRHTYTIPTSTCVIPNSFRDLIHPRVVPFRYFFHIIMNFSLKNTKITKKKSVIPNIVILLSRILLYCHSELDSESHS